MAKAERQAKTERTHVSQILAFCQKQAGQKCDTAKLECVSVSIKVLSLFIPNHTVYKLSGTD